MLIKKTALLTFIITLVLLGSNLLPQARFTDEALAQDKAAPAAESQDVIEPAADDLLKEMSDTLKAAEDFTFDTEVTFDELLPSGQKVQFGGTLKSFVKRPDRIFVEYTGDLAKRKVWYSQKAITILDENRNLYGELTTPGNIDDTMDFLMENYDFSLPLADIVSSDLYGSVSGGTVEGVLIGESEVRGAPCEHLAFVGENVDWQVWIASEKPTLPCKLVITYKKLEGGPQYEAIFSNWKLNTGLKDDIFKPSLPESASKIDFIELKKKQGEKK